MRLPARLCLMVALSCASVPLHADDLWFEGDGLDQVLFRGHRFVKHTGAADRIPYDPDTIQLARCLRGGQTTELSRPYTDYPLRIAGPCTAVAATLYSGYWSESPAGPQNKPRTEVPGATDSWYAIESVKQIFSWDEQLLVPQSDELDLIPTSNPLGLERSDKLRLVATFRGRPVAGVTVAYDGDPRGVTDKEGNINLRIRHSGFQVITASIEEPVKNELADKWIRSAVLLFELP